MRGRSVSLAAAEPGDPRPLAVSAAALFDAVEMVIDDLVPRGEIDTLSEAVEKVNLILSDAMPQWYVGGDDEVVEFGHAVIQKAIAFHWRALKSLGGEEE